MRPYLESYMNILSANRRQQVSGVLESVLVSRDRVSESVDALSQRSNFSDVSLSNVRTNSVMRSSTLQSNINNISRAVNEMYEISNDISVAINSHSALLLSQLRAAEKEVELMEKVVDNFAFMLSDAEGYDFGYLEPFEDDGLRDEGLGFVPDRTGIGFTWQDMAPVDRESNSLSLSTSLDRSYGLRAKILDSNAGAYTVMETDVQEAASTKPNTGWHVTVASASPIRAAMEGSGGRFGAQFRLEFRLEEPVPCSALSIRPMSEIEPEILSIRLFDSEQGTAVEVLDQPKVLSQSLLLHFPVQSVLKFEILINQPTFIYALSKAEKREIEHAKALKQVERIRQERALSKIVKLQQDIRSEVFAKEASAQSASTPSSSILHHRGVMDNLSTIVKYNKDSLWTQGSNPLTNLFRTKAMPLFPAFSRHSAQYRIRMENSITSPSPSSALLRLDSPQDTGESLSGFNYYYDLGLGSVSIGTEEVRFRGVFVSRPLEDSGDIGEMRIKTDDVNVIGDITRDSRYLTSIEYSVSNKPDPKREIDWVPILPVGTDEVKAERLFIGPDRKCYFRFPAVGQGSISIYRNGMVVKKGVRLIPGEFDYIIGAELDRSVYNPEDIFTCDYVPAGDHTLISFAQKGFKDPSLVFAYDERGAGEGFRSTGNLNMITLSKLPYVDPILMGSESYQPITVRLDSGLVYENLTDYRSGQNPILPKEGRFYLHEKQTLAFNTPIHEPFRVYYQYLEGNTRVRVILRCNNRDFTTPQVNYMHVKAKVRSNDISQF